MKILLLLLPLLSLGGCRAILEPMNGEHVSVYLEGRDLKQGTSPVTEVSRIYEEELGLRHESTETLPDGGATTRTYNAPALAPGGRVPGKMKISYHPGSHILNCSAHPGYRRGRAMINRLKVRLAEEYPHSKVKISTIYRGFGP